MLYVSLALIEGAKQSMDDKAASKARAQKRKDRSAKGQTGGRSKYDVPGSHHKIRKGAGADWHARKKDKYKRQLKRRKQKATQSKKNGKN